MPDTFEQGGAARPFKKQFPELSDAAAARLDEINQAILLLHMRGIITDQEASKIRRKRFPTKIAGALYWARKEAEQ